MCQTLFSCDLGMKYSGFMYIWWNPCEKVGKNLVLLLIPKFGMGREKLELTQNGVIQKLKSWNIIYSTLVPWNASLFYPPTHIYLYSPWYQKGLIPVYPVAPPDSDTLKFGVWFPYMCGFLEVGKWIEMSNNLIGACLI